MITPTKTIPDGRRCINCYAPARRGAITHLPGCPEWTKPAIQPKTSRRKAVPAPVPAPAQTPAPSTVRPAATAANQMPEPVVANERLVQLATLYDQLKRQRDETAERFDAVVAAIKVELANAVPGAFEVELRSPHLAAPLRLQAKTQRRLDTKKLREQHPAVYEQFAVPVTYWELRTIPGGGA